VSVGKPIRGRVRPFIACSCDSDGDGDAILVLVLVLTLKGGSTRRRNGLVSAYPECVWMSKTIVDEARMPLKSSPKAESLRQADA
jgi:hypothetical protein